MVDAVISYHSNLLEKPIHCFILIHSIKLFIALFWFKALNCWASPLNWFRGSRIKDSVQVTDLIQKISSIGRFIQSSIKYPNWSFCSSELCMFCKPCCRNCRGMWGKVSRNYLYFHFNIHKILVFPCQCSVPTNIPVFLCSRKAHWGLFFFLFQFFCNSDYPFR